MGEYFQIIIDDSGFQITQPSEHSYSGSTTTVETTLPPGGQEADLGDPAMIGILGGLGLLSAVALKACQGSKKKQ